MVQSSDRPVVAIVSLDLHGYSRLTEQDEVGTHRALMDCWRKRLRPIVDDHQGIIVKSTGDGALIRFSDAPAAVKAMVCFQEQVAAAEACFPETLRLVFRVGIHLAPIIQENGDLYGNGVNLAVRLQENAEPGTIMISQTVADEITHEKNSEFSYLGKQRVKNIKKLVTAYEWRREKLIKNPLRNRTFIAVASVTFAVLFFSTKHF